MPVLEVQVCFDYRQLIHFNFSCGATRHSEQLIQKTRSVLLFGNVKRPLPSGSWHGRGLLRL